MAEYCTNCGSKMKDGALFCTKCGKKTSVEKTSTKSKVTIGLFFFIIVIITSFIAWRGSPYWPWPTDKEVQERMEKVVGACSNKEKSSECEKSKKLYHAKFQYCVRVKNSLASLWTISGEYEGVYAVAWQDNYSTPDDMTDKTGINYLVGYTYSGCRDTMAEVEELLFKVEETKRHFNN